MNIFGIAFHGLFIICQRIWLETLPLILFFILYWLPIHLGHLSFIGNLIRIKFQLSDFFPVLPTSRVCWLHNCALLCVSCSGWKVTKVMFSLRRSPLPYFIDNWIGFGIVPLVFERIKMILFVWLLKNFLKLICKLLVLSFFNIL